MQHETLLTVDLLKWLKSPYNWVIYPLTQPLVANQKQKKTVDLLSLICCGYFGSQHWISLFLHDI